jgi:hypothetical protein
MGVKTIYTIKKILATHMTIEVKSFNINHVIFLELVQNRIIKGLFSNIIYSDSNVIFNGIYINVHRNMTQKLADIENDVLKQYSLFFNTSKEPIHSFKVATTVDEFSTKFNSVNWVSLNSPTYVNSPALCMHDSKKVFCGCFFYSENSEHFRKRNRWWITVAGTEF